MKYHGLKMEEVNDTMKHLWNKTYQGTGTSDWCLSFDMLIPRPQTSTESKFARTLKAAHLNVPTIIVYVSILYRFARSFTFC